MPTTLVRCSEPRPSSLLPGPVENNGLSAEQVDTCELHLITDLKGGSLWFWARMLHFASVFTKLLKYEV